MILAVSAETLRQLTVDGFFRGCSYGLLGVGFALILGVTGRFHFAYGFTYTLAAYMAFTFTFRVDLPFWPGAVLGVLAAAARRGVDRTLRLPAARRQRRTERTPRGVRRRPRARHRGRQPDPAVLGFGDAGLLRPDEEGLPRVGHRVPELRRVAGRQRDRHHDPARSHAALLRTRETDQGHPRQPRPRPHDRHRRR